MRKEADSAASSSFRVLWRVSSLLGRCVFFLEIAWKVFDMSLKGKERVFISGERVIII